MRILILDDDWERLARFEKMYIGHRVTCVETVGEAISELEANKFDVLFLDHDLGHRVHVESDGLEETGYLVALWLADNPQHKPETIIVHSLNEIGSKNILSVLPEAVRKPFAWIQS